MQTTIKMLTDGLEIFDIEAEFEPHCNQKGYVILSDGAAQVFDYSEHTWSEAFNLKFDHPGRSAAPKVSFVYYKKWADGCIIGENQEVLYVQSGTIISDAYRLLEKIREFLKKDNHNYSGCNTYMYLSAKEF